MAAVLLLTHRPAFELTWSAALQRRQLAARPASLDGVREALHPGDGLLIDLGSLDFGDDDLLACLAHARSRDAVVAIASAGDRLARLGDLLAELCAGLIARSDADCDAVALGLSRRLDPARFQRFAHVGATHGGEQLIAVTDDARMLLRRRPWSPEDSGAPLETIALGERGTSVRITLRDGQTLELAPNDLTRDGASPSSPPSAAPGALGDVDGVRLGQRLRALRVAAGLTQAELARRTGIHRPNIARVEAGRHTPSLETLARLAAAIGVSTTRVLSD
jgi:DNA-binding XRE family transcriptional regulator